MIAANVRRLASNPLIAAAVAVQLAAGCAHVGYGPPGGPEDHAPPQLLAVTPDTGAVNSKPKEIVFRFDETVSERPTGANSLDALFLLSPSDGVPRVSWHRKAITIRPRKGFRNNTAYTVTMLPGLADLRGNSLKSTTTTFFSTGAEIPPTALRGIVFDWVAGKPAPHALVQAFRPGDTTFAWMAATDSVGRFEIRAFPAGTYKVRAMIDANNNRTLDPREAYDTLIAAVADSARVELLAFVHDSLGPRIDRLNVEDSLTLRVDFDMPYEPTRPVTAAQFTLLRSDSTTIPIVALLTDSAYAAEREAAVKARADSARRANPARAAADSARTATPAPNVPAGTAPRDARATAPASPTRSAVPLPNRRGGAPAPAPRDTTPLPKPSRPAPSARVILRLGTPVTPGAAYRLRAADVWGLSGAPRTSDRVFTAPKAAAPVAADSTANRRPTLPTNAVPNATPKATPAAPPAASATPRPVPPVKP